MVTQDIPITIAAYTNDLWEHVCPRVRLLSPASAAGINVIRASQQTESGLQVDLEAIAKADVVFILRDFPRLSDAYSAVVEEARRLKKKVIFELDDLLFDLPDLHPDLAFYRAVRYRLLEAAIEADALIVTTENLRLALESYNSRIIVVPNYLDDDLWREALPRSDGDSSSREPLVIGYQGGGGHIPDIEAISPALVRILQRYGQRVKIKFWGTPPPEALRAWPNVEWLNPGLTDYASFVDYFQHQACDIFIAPVIDNNFNACKSPLKFLEYSALGVAGIYSRGPTFTQVVNDGQNGLLAATVEEWESSLVRLIEDAPLRHAIGRAARDTVRQDWLLSEHAGKFRFAVEQILKLPSQEVIDPVLKTLVKQSDRWQMELEMKLRLGTERLSEQQRRLELAETDLNNIKNGIGWNLLQKMHRITERVAPEGSARANWLGKGMDRIRHLRNKETVKARLKLRKGESMMIFDGDDLRPVIFQPRHKDIEKKTGSPLVSLLVLDQMMAPTPKKSEITDWLDTQTWKDVELVDWHRESSGEGDLLSEIQGKYVCVVSPDLLRQCPTYLETNLIALESEELLFTVNSVTGTRSGEGNIWFRDRIKAGSFPGDSETPLLRTVVRSDCLGTNLEIDLSKVLVGSGSVPAIVGRVISHASNFPDHKLSFPYNNHLKGGGLHLLGSNIVAYPFASEVPHSAIRHSINQPIPLEGKAIVDERPTILMVMPFLAVGGAERIAIYMMRGLASKIRFVIVTIEPLDPGLGTMAEDFRQITPYIYSFPDFLTQPLYLDGFDYLMRRFSPDTLYIANGCTWIYDALPQLKKPYPQLRVINQVYDHVAGWINRYDSRLIRLIDGHISSNANIDHAYVNKGVHSGQIYHIENGIDTNWYDPSLYDSTQVAGLREQLGIPREKKIVTFIARLHPQKRPLDFIEIARRCMDHSNLHFLMVGDGPLSDAVDQEIRRCGLNNITRLPFYTPSRDIFAVSDVMMLTSEYEGMPMVVLEAQSMGKPFVSTHVGNIQEVLGKTGGGQAVALPGDITALIASIQQVIVQPVDPSTIRAAIIENYSLEKMTQKYAKALLREDND